MKFVCSSMSLAVFYLTGASVALSEKIRHVDVSADATAGAMKHLRQLKQPEHDILQPIPKKAFSAPAPPPAPKPPKKAAPAPAPEVEAPEPIQMKASSKSEDPGAPIVVDVPKSAPAPPPAAPLFPDHYEDVPVPEISRAPAVDDVTDAIPTEVKVPGMPQELQLLFAFAWVGIIGSIPMILARIDPSQNSNTMQRLAIVLWITLFGGVYLFTNIILFQSPHFKDGEIRPLTIIECIYLMSQAITTVGYGDITPAKPRGQVFVGLYVVGALCVISFFVSQLINHIGRVAEEYKKHYFDEPANESEAGPSTNLLVMMSGKPPKPNLQPFRDSMLGFLIIDFVWICFFHYYPGEGKSWMEAIYMSVITLSTVGFGAFTPVTEGGMVFAAFFMLFGSAALVNAIGQFAELMIQHKIYETYDASATERALVGLEKQATGSTKDFSGKVSELDFFKFALQSQGILDEAGCENITQAFAELRPKTGMVNVSDVRAAVRSVI
eukprot:TRINITY_DN4837_c0_g3_i1.p1 TRINITY_DN4837_c0_g3~~TRINITY_DN4837_c0_g3_i1.p1  ORF type:complete len:495 (-),score=115.18 TRINITY_DN4837_c0_g3_i1:146-1630(-)